MGAILQAYADRAVARGAEMDALWASLDIEYHCAGRHGVIRDVAKADVNKVAEAIDYFMGHGAARWTGTARSKKRSVEFVPMTKVFPAPRRPWQWCGETVLFKSWREEEEANRAAADTFTAGEAVTFEHKGETKRGAFIHINRSGRAAVLINGEGQWTVPARLLNKEW